MLREIGRALYQKNRRRIEDYLVLKKNRELIIAFLSFTLIMVIATVATAALTDMIWTWNRVNMYGEEVNNGIYIWMTEAGTANGISEKKTRILGVLR